MGSCGLCQKNSSNREVFIKKKTEIKDPAVFIEENFKILDHTGQLDKIENIWEVREKFLNYKATDLRCVKGPRESKHDHSHLIIMFNKKNPRRSNKRTMLNSKLFSLRFRFVNRGHGPNNKRFEHFPSNNRVPSPA